MKNEIEAGEEKLITVGIAVLFHAMRIMGRGKAGNLNGDVAGGGVRTSIREAKAFVNEAKSEGLWPVKKEAPR